MNVAVLSESEADEAAIRIFAEAVYPAPITWIDKPPLRSRGWPSVLNVLPTVLKHLHYQTLAERLIVVADSNHTPVHTARHLEQQDENCRCCKLCAVANDVVAGLTPIAGKSMMRVVVGLAVPAIEAWYLLGRGAGVSEEAWINGRAQGRDPYSKRQLKSRVYGTEIPSLYQETQQAINEANRVVTQLDQLVAAFPGGFGLFMQAVQTW